jgi:ankyrin repeat protein
VAEFVAAIRRGDAVGLSRLLDADRGLAIGLIDGRTPLHLFADAPGHRPNPAAVVAVLAGAGADLNAAITGSWHQETPLHWAPSNDDVALIDALLDAGADLERAGSSIDGGPPVQSALGYAQWRAVARLRERGARTGLPHAAVLGLQDEVIALTGTEPPPEPGVLSVAFWNACRAGQLGTAQYLLHCGAELDWPAPWSGETPLDAAQQQRQTETVAWLTDAGACSGAGLDTPAPG